VLSEGFEIFGGVLPTHAIETILQLKREDWEKLKKGYQALQDIRSQK
jgi:hypothetical protein